MIALTTPSVRKKKIGLSMALSIRVSGIVEESIVDGPGLRYVVFAQGCPHFCKGCHNPETHCGKGGYSLEVRAVLEQFKQNPLLSGITLSGGEPFMQPSSLLELAQAVKQLGKSVVAYTGFTFEQLLKRSETNIHIRKLLGICDLLIDGPYIEQLKDLELQFRGSSNQRILAQEEMVELRTVYEAKQVNLINQANQNCRGGQSNSSYLENDACYLNLPLEQCA